MFMRRIPTQEQRYILADLLRHGREAQDLTQQQISDLLDCSLHWVNDMEQGKCDPSWRDAFHYAAIIKLDPIVFAEEAGLRVSIPSFRMRKKLCFCRMSPQIFPLCCTLPVFLPENSSIPFIFWMCSKILFE